MKIKPLSLTAVIIIVFAGCQTSTSNEDPTGVLRQFIYALSKKDLMTARSLASDDSQTTFNMMQMGVGKKMPADLENLDTARLIFGTPQIDGNTAAISVKDKKSGEALDFKMVKENEKWKVSFGLFELMGMGMKKMKEKGIEISDTMMGKLPDLRNLNIDSLKNILERKKIKIPDSIRIILENKKQP